MANQNTTTDRPMATAAAAAYCGLQAHTLVQWRKQGRGPRFLKLGDGRTSAIRYRPADLDAWLESCVRRSTSDDQQAAR